MSGSRRPHLITRTSVAAFIALACLSLGACSNKSVNLGDADPMATGSTSPPSLKETAKLGNEWQKDPKNLRVGLAYAAQLKKLGQNDRQLQVLATLVQYHPADPALLSTYGRDLAQAGQPDQAQPVLAKAIASGSTDWKVYSA